MKTRYIKAMFHRQLNTFYKISLSILAIYAIQACRPKFYEDPVPSTVNAGSLDLTKYVAIGSSITAGYADNALYSEAQNAAYPNLLAARFKDANSALNYVQADVNSANGWSSGSLGRFKLTTPACNTVAVGGVALSTSETAVPAYTGVKTSVTNLAVPFIRITNINTAAVSSGSAANNPKPYYDRITSIGTKGIAYEAKARAGSFFTVWLGYTDALRYATSGGTTALVSTSVFEANINAILDSLLANPNAKGVVGLVPYVHQFPVVTNNNRRLTSSNDPVRNPVRLTQDEASTFNTAIGVANLFKGTTGNNNYYAIEVSGTNPKTIRQLNVSNDFIVRANDLNKAGKGKIDPFSVRSCTPDTTQRNKLGFTKAFSDTAVLDKGEVDTLITRIKTYNDAIRKAVSEKNVNGTRIAIVEFDKFFTQLSDPLQGIAFGSTIVRTNHPALGPDFGGFFSMDRINPTPKGQALLANEYLKVINQTFGSNFSLYDPDNFRANSIPNQ
jgi:lysophospholipase L1-like esterase